MGLTPLRHFRSVSFKGRMADLARATTVTCDARVRVGPDPSLKGTARDIIVRLRGSPPLLDDK